MPEDESLENLTEILDFLKEEYQIDETRVYSVGLSMGGNRSYMNATTDPTMFAAITACGQPILFNGTAAAEDLSEIGGVAVYNIVGEYDAFNHYPFTVDGFLTSEEKITGINTWLTANNLIYEEPVTAESITDLTEHSEDEVKKHTGIDFTSTYILDLDGVDYWTGEFENENGVNTLRVSLIQGAPHWTTPSTARVSWDFMKHFSRDPQTKELVYEAENAEKAK